MFHDSTVKLIEAATGNMMRIVCDAPFCVFLDLLFNVSAELCLVDDPGFSRMIPFDALCVTMRKIDPVRSKAATMYAKNKIAPTTLSPPVSPYDQASDIKRKGARS